MTELVRLEVEDGIGTIRLDRPPMNALCAQLGRELGALLPEITERSDISAVIVHGGEKVFAAGADIKEMADLDLAGMTTYGRLLQDFTNGLAALPKPTIAAITGYALGGGFELALCCDFRIAGATAKVGFPEITLGVIPGMGGTQRAARLIGPSRAKEIVFSGRFIGAEEALAMGLVNQVVPEDEDVYAAARAWAPSSPRRSRPSPAAESAAYPCGEGRGRRGLPAGHGGDRHAAERQVRAG